jgi:hypothetical protein
MAQRLVDGLLEPGRDDGAEAHARACPACATLVESYRLLGDALDDLELPELPDDFTSGVLARIERVEVARTRERRLATAILAAALLVATGALLAAGSAGLATTLGGWADGLGEASVIFRVGRGILPGLLSALRLPLMVGAAALALPLLLGLNRLMPSAHHARIS